MGLSFHFSLTFKSALTRIAFLSDKVSITGCGLAALTTALDDESRDSSIDWLCFTRCCCCSWRWSRLERGSLALRGSTLTRLLLPLLLLLRGSPPPLRRGSLDAFLGSPVLCEEGDGVAFGSWAESDDSEGSKEGGDWLPPLKWSEDSLETGLRC